MQKELVIVQEMRVVGLLTRTNNENEHNHELAKIGPLTEDYLKEKVATAIQDRTNPGVTYAIYTDFDTDEGGDYTYLVGEQVNTASNQELSHLEMVEIVPGAYQKFTTEPGKMPDVLISAWEAIWEMSEEELGGQRAYQTDFEVYDERTEDHNQAVIDIYIGLK